ncbi:hypothetical protein LOK49_LG04G02421 [Camellia lanceoleosa]|uniref:Uncharacterized protein n=1 Tax=Camellia lanceoleosa TaxID=1840588 RepID=A0ACC0I006_9ERIC|nr:hypothetical protein LOK49_LG04G02421 [Camellia lanceoleosa]
MKQIQNTLCKNKKLMVKTRYSFGVSIRKAQNCVVRIHFHSLSLSIYICVCVCVCVCAGVNGTTSLDGDSNGSRRGVLKKVKDFLRKAQKGKGSYGGANIVHHRPQRSAAAAAASLLKGSFS